MTDAKRVRLPSAVVLLGLTSLFTDVGTEMIFPLLPVFLTGTLGAGAAYLGLVEGAATTVASLLKLVSGTLADRLSRRKPLVLLGYGVASATRPFVALATRPWHVLAVRVTDRVGKGIRGAPRDALIADAAGDRAGRAFGFQQAMDNVGAVIGPLLATAMLASGMSLRGVFWVSILPGAIATGLVALIREPPRDRAPKKAAPGERAAGVLTPSLSTYLAILAVFSLGNSSDAFLLLRAQSLGVPTASIPILWSIHNASRVVWSWLGGDLADRMRRTWIVAAGWVVYAASYLALGRATAAWHAWAIFVVYGVFYGLTEPVEKALLKDLVREDQRGRAYGAYNFVVGVTTLPAGLLTGFLWQTWGPAVALEAGAALAGAAGVMLLAWDTARRRG